MSAPLLYRWTDERMVPVPSSLNNARRQFAPGGMYRLDVYRERSPASHSHYFAAVHEGWANLPEHMVERFPTSEHLRKWCLIKSGYHDSRSIVAATKAEAQRIAFFVKPSDEFAVVTVTDALVTVYTARSQSRKAMAGPEFQKSKDDVLAIIEQMTGVERGDLKRNAGKAA